ncbi:MAG TPA: PIG-L deacetylase family protein [Alphaproteobacteria bacterium]|nr:PIG-L deacetylase family protein [Alphaproteobacteria bacterium]
MKLLAVMAHPDDAEIWAGGTIAKHIQRGDEVLIVYMTATEDSLRGEEAKKGAAILGAQVLFMGLVDGQVRDTPETSTRMREVLMSSAPDIIVTHWLDDGHADHAATAAVVQRTLPFVMADIGKTVRVWACDTYFSLGPRGPFVPDVYVDVTQQWAIKLAAVRAHQSQHPEGWVTLLERQCGLHAHRATHLVGAGGRFYAEGFRRLIPFGYITPVDYLDS